VVVIVGVTVGVTVFVGVGVTVFVGDGVHVNVGVGVGVGILKQACHDEYSNGEIAHSCTYHDVPVGLVTTALPKGPPTVGGYPIAISCES